MVTIGMNYTVCEGKGQIFEDHFARVLEAMSLTEGHVETHLFRDCMSDRSYLVVSEWAEREHFDAFVTSDAFRKVTRWGLSGILEGRPRHQVYSPREMGRPVATKPAAKHPALEA